MPLQRKIGVFVILPLVVATALVDDDGIAFALSIVTFVAAVLLLVVILRQRRASR